MDDEIVGGYEEKNKLNNLLSNIGVGTIIIFGIIFGVFIYVNQNKSLDPRYNYVIFGVLVCIIIYLIYKPTGKKKLISREDAAKIALRELNKMKQIGKEISFDDEVCLTGWSKLRFKDDAITDYYGPIAWDIGYSILIKGTQYKKDGIISIHPYDGTITGMRAAPLGYDGRQDPDIKVIPVRILQGNIKTTDMGGQPRV